MSLYTPDTKRWMLTGIACGFATLVTYVIATQVPTGLSLKASYVLFMAFGPLFCAAVLAFYMFLREEQNSVALSVGTLLIIIGGGINTTMAAMQGALRIYFDDLPHDETVLETTQTAWKMGLHSGNALQLGADMAWDVYVLGGLLVFGFGIMKHPRFGVWFGWPAILIGAGGLVLNAWSFPTPPDSAGLFDVGPLVGLWFTAVTIQVIRCLRKSAA